MMEEIDFFDQGIATNPFEVNQKNASASSDTPATPAFISASSNNSEMLRLPRTGGSSRVNFLRDTFQSQIPTNDQLQKTKQQAGRVFKSFGNRLSKINLGKLIDNMEQDQGVADSLEKLNNRMKEEVLRQDVRREAVELTLKVIIDHLNEFLVEEPLGTYEEWIQDLHPENANQGKLFSDIQQIDERFYVMESDHRKLWNDAIEKQETEKDGDTNNKTSHAHRLVEARTQIWGKAPGANTNTPSQNSESGYNDNPLDNNSIPTNHNPMIDLLSDSDVLLSNTQSTSAAATPAPRNDNGIEDADYFAPTVNSATNHINASGNTSFEPVKNDRKKNDPLQDLIQF